MGSPRTGSTGVVESKGDILVFDGIELQRLPVGANAEFLTALATEATGLKWLGTDGIPGLGYPMSYGGEFPTAASQGRFFVGHGTSSSPNESSLNENSELVFPKFGTIKRISWRTESASATTVLVIWKNGIVSATITLTGLNGVITGLSVAIVAGDRVGLEYDSGTAPGNISVDLFVE